MFLIPTGNKLVWFSPYIPISFRFLLTQISYFRGLAILWLLGSHVFLRCQGYIFMFWSRKSPWATSEAQGFPFPYLFLVFLGYWFFSTLSDLRILILGPFILKLCFIWSSFPFAQCHLFEGFRHFIVEDGNFRYAVILYDLLAWFLFLLFLTVICNKYLSIIVCVFVIFKPM